MLVRPVAIGLQQGRRVGSDGGTPIGDDDAGVPVRGTEIRDHLVAKHDRAFGGPVQQDCGTAEAGEAGPADDGGVRRADRDAAFAQSMEAGVHQGHVAAAVDQHAPATLAEGAARDRDLR